MERFYSWNRNACLSWEKHVGKLLEKQKEKQRARLLEKRDEDVDQSFDRGWSNG